MQPRFYWLEAVEFSLWAASFLILVAMVVGLSRQWRELRQGIVVSRCLPARRTAGWMVPALGLLFALPCFIGLLVLTDGRRLIVQFALSFAGALLAWAGCTGLYAFLVSRFAQHLRETERWDRTTESVCWELQLCITPDEIHAACLHIFRRNLRCVKAVLFLQSGQAYQAQSIEEAQEAPLSAQFSTHSLLAQRLRQGGLKRCLAVADLQTGRSLRWTNGHSSKFAREQALLAAMDARLAVPLMRGASLLGFWVLGPPESGFSYLAPQIHLAASVAAQAVSSLVAGEARHSAQTTPESVPLSSPESVLAVKTRWYLASPPPPIHPELEIAAVWHPSDNGVLWTHRVMSSGEICLLLAYAQEAGEGSLAGLLQMKQSFHAVDEASLSGWCTVASPSTTGMILVRYQPDGQRLHYDGVGLISPVLIQRKENGLETRRLPLSPDPESTFQMQPGDIVMFPSAHPDDATGKMADAWGHHEVLRQLLLHGGDPAQQLAETAITEVQRVSGIATQTLTTAMLLLRCSTVPSLNSTKSTAGQPMRLPGG